MEACNQGAPFMQLKSTLTCPGCGHRSVETMPTDACQFFYDCKGCGERLKPLAGDCCVFCSYGSIPCPPMQGSRKCCKRFTGPAADRRRGTRAVDRPQKTDK